MSLRASPVVLLCAVLATLAGVAGTPGTARAERSALFVGGGAAQEGIAKTARATIESAGWSVTEPPVAAGPLADLLTCVQGGLGGDCVPGYLDDHDVDRGVIIRVSMDRGKGGTTHTVTGWVFRRAGELLVTDKRTCERCADHAVETTVRELVEALIKEARSRARPTLLDIRSNPTGAVVKIDGKEVGVTDLQIEVYAGVHAVYFELAGHHGESREVVVGDGESMTVEVRLTVDSQARPAGPIKLPPDDAGAARRGPLPWVLTGGGVALVATGLVLFTLDEAAVQDELQVASYRDTTIPAIAAAGAGAVLTGVGVWMLLRSNGGSEDGSPRPTVSFGAGGAALGVAGRF